MYFAEALPGYLATLAMAEHMPWAIKFYYAEWHHVAGKLQANYERRYAEPLECAEDCVCPDCLLNSGGGDVDAHITFDWPDADDESEDAVDDDIMGAVFAGSPVGKVALYARCAKFDAEREAKYAYSYGLLPVPPPATEIRWFCPNCGYDHATKFYGQDMAECGCGARRLWENVHMSEFKFAAAKKLYLEWLVSAKTYIEPTRRTMRVVRVRGGQFIMRRNDRLTDERVNIRLPASMRFSQQYKLFAAGQVH